MKAEEKANLICNILTGLYAAVIIALPIAIIITNKF